jgi:Spy/CpxP family protein refolding chaperone
MAECREIGLLRTTFRITIHRRWTMRRILVFAAIAAVLVIAATAVAQMLPFGRAPAWKVRQFADEVGVPAGTIESFLKERNELRKRLLRTKGDMAIARLELEEVFEADQVDAKEAEARHEKLLDLERQLRRDMLESRIAVRKTFTHEQLEQIREMMPPPRRDDGPDEPGARRRMGRRPGHRFGYLDEGGPPEDDFLLGDG